MRGRRFLFYRYFSLIYFVCYYDFVVYTSLRDDNRVCNTCLLDDRWLSQLFTKIPTPNSKMNDRRQTRIDQSINHANHTETLTRQEHRGYKMDRQALSRDRYQV
jgi:hypothetical protein